MVELSDLPKGRYKTIYADPPWPERGGGKIKRGADRHYPLMTVEQIKALPVQRLASPDGCHLYLWTTNNYLPEAFEVIKAWGFEYVTAITWAKDKIGLGQYFRGLTEHCLFATTAKRLPYKSIEGKRQQGVTGFFAAKTEHSAKPCEMRQMIERVSYAPRVELFARQQHPGWDCWGNETPDSMRPEREGDRIVRCRDCIHQNYDAEYGRRWCDYYLSSHEVRADGSGFCDRGKAKED